MFNLEKALNFDALATAEQLTGNKGEATSLALALSIENSHHKRNLLRVMNDTVLGDGLDSYISKITKAGFEEVLKEPFIGDPEGSAHKETFYIYARKDGLLLVFDTYSEIRVNGANLYFNYQADGRPDGKFSGGLSRQDYDRYCESSRQEPDDYKKARKVFLKGGLPVYVLRIDAREALFYNMAKVEGKTLPKWKDRGFLYLRHYQDNADLPAKYDPDLLVKDNEKRIAKLPEWVQDMIKGE